MTSAQSQSPAAATASPPDGRLDPALVKLAVILLIGAMAAFLDTTIVNVAIDAMGRELHAPVATTQWVLTGYLLSFGMVVPVSGWALRRFGGRVTWLASLAIFLAGSVACGLAWNMASLITFRVLQGIGGGLMIPIMMTLLMQAAGGRNLGRTMAAVSLPVVVVPILGPVLGGLIISHLSWRWIFYVNVPVCLVGLALAWRGLRLPRPGRAARGGSGRLDVTGLALLSPGVAAILYGFAQVTSAGGFGHPAVLVPLAAGLAAVALFTVRAARGQRDPQSRPEPVIDLRLFRVRSFTGSASLMFLSGLSLYGAMLLLPLYYQQVRGASPLAAGLLLAPQGIGSLLPRMAAGKLTDRLGPRPVALAGIAVAALGTVPFALVGAHTSEVWLSCALVVRGAGLSSAMIAVMSSSYDGLTPAQIPHASSATRIVQQVGGAFGASVLAVILTSAAASGAPGPAGLAAAFGQAFWWCLAFTALALPPALLLRGRIRQESGQAAPVS